MAAAVVVHTDSRSHVNILTGHDILPTDESAAIIADALFVVRRRSLT
jgi:hypothetical protein